jgi:hypothetical protein
VLFSEGRVRTLVEQKLGRNQGNSMRSLLTDLGRGAKAAGTRLTLPAGFLRAVERAANDAVPMHLPRQKHAYSVELVSAFVVGAVRRAGGIDAARGCRAGELAVMATLALGTAGRVGDLLKLQEDCVQQVGERAIRFVLRGPRSAKADLKHEGETACMQFPVWEEVDTWALFEDLWRRTPRGGLIFKIGRVARRSDGLVKRDESSRWADALSREARRLGLVGPGVSIQVHGFRRGALLAMSLKGYPFEVVQALAGWRDARSGQAYIQRGIRTVRGTFAYLQPEAVAGSACSLTDPLPQPGRGSSGALGLTGPLSFGTPPCCCSGLARARGASSPRRELVCQARQRLALLAPKGLAGAAGGAQEGPSVRIERTR